MKRLSPEQEEKGFDLILQHANMQEIAAGMGLSGLKALQRYLIKFPEFAKAYQEARKFECADLEQQYKNVLHTYTGQDARTQMEILHNLLKWRDRNTYGDKVQTEVKMELGISERIKAAEERLALIDVTPNVLELQKSSKTK